MKDFSIAPHFINSFAALPESFYSKQTGDPLPEATLEVVVEGAAALLGLTAQEIQSDPAWAKMLSAGPVLAGADPLAAVYAGHQFGVWAGRLGDGRALLLGEIESPDKQSSWELQLKGSGQTPYSRRADGYAVLRSSIRELLCSEAFAGLGIPTTRALSMSVSDRPVIRETVETSAIVCRMAPSFIRFGTFEYFCHFNRHDDLKTLADYVIAKFYPTALESENPYAQFLQLVTQRTAKMVAHWQSIGFCHGVMNTDNMSILGLTIDYGPFGFLDAFDAEHICNHSDNMGRYSFGNQPQIAHWNCYCLAQALMPLIKDTTIAETALSSFTPAFETAYIELIRAKMGLSTPQAEDVALINDTMALLQSNRTDFTLFFRTLSTIHSDTKCRDLMMDWNGFELWKQRYLNRLEAESISSVERKNRMDAVNPAYILRNHLAEIAIQQARGDNGEPDFSEVHRLLKALQHPCDEYPEFDDLAQLPPQWASDLSVSCSS
jgi:serine/tyrosine/threonine adenylyltransferase